jgi:predicted PurR-regulated permease PerM
METNAGRDEPTMTTSSGIRSSGVDPSHRNHRSVRGDILFVFAVLGLIWVAWLVRDVLVLLYVSALFAVVLSPVVRSVGRIQIGRWRPFRGIALMALLLAAAAALTGFCFLAIPPVARDLSGMGGEMPARLPALLTQLRNLPFVSHLNTDEIVDRVQGFASTAGTQLLLSIRNWAGELVSIITGVVLTIYFILDGERAYKWFLSFFAPAPRERLDRTLRRAEVRMGKWLLGQGSLMLLLGLLSTTLYLALDIRYPYALGVVTGMLNIVPVLGAAICIVLAALVAALDSWGRALGVVIFFVAYLWVENWFLTPRIMKSSVDLPALGILVALLLGAGLAGIAGAMVAIPTAVLITVLIDEYLVYKNNPETAASESA